MSGGRPTEFTDELIQAAYAYVDGGWETEGHAIPSIVGLCKVINRGKSTLYDWAKRDDNPFSDILESIKEEQELVLFNRALKNEYNASIAKLALGKHGYHEKADVNHGGQPDNPVGIATINVLPVKPAD